MNLLKFIWRSLTTDKRVDPDHRWNEGVRAAQERVIDILIALAEGYDDHEIDLVLTEAVVCIRDDKTLIRKLGQAAKALPAVVVPPPLSITLKDFCFMHNVWNCPCATAGSGK